LKKLRLVRDTSEGDKSPTCCGLKNRHEERAPAQLQSAFILPWDIDS